jgi:pimeloyl-ACP methyl ester carboxylesterase
MTAMPWRPWAARTVEVAAPDDVGRVDGLAYALYAPDGEARGGVVVLHGAGSVKESHLDFARRARAAGLAAVAFDMRGHGETGGALDGRLIEDVATVAGLLPAGVPVGLRGSSMGGYLALVAGAALGADAVVAICPASAAGLWEGVRTGRLGFAADVATVGPALEAHDERDAAMALGDRLLLLHAEGDEVVPVAHSRELHALAPGSRLVAVPGGHHRSVQHDAELQGESVRFLARRLAAAAG